MDDVKKEIMTNSVEALLTNESYSELLTLDAAEYRIRALGRDDPMEYVLFIEVEDDQFIISILGQVNVLQLPTMFRNISQADSTQNFGVADLLSRIRGNREDSRRRQPADTTQQDSIQNLEP